MHTKVRKNISYKEKCKETIKYRDANQALRHLIKLLLKIVLHTIPCRPGIV